MKKVTLLIALLFILTACQSRLTPAPVEILPTPSRTPSPTATPTPNATERYQGTLQANQTQNAGYALTLEVKGTGIAQTQTVQALTPTQTPTIPPTPTPTNTPTPFLILPPVQGEASAYRLVTPSPAFLLKFQIFNTSQDENTVYSDVIQKEWQRAYTYSPELMEMIRNSVYQGWYSWYSEEMLMSVVGDYIVEQFNQKGLDFEEDYFSIQTYPIEIDQDTTPEWFILIRNPELIWSEDSFSIVVDQTEDGHFTRLVNQLPWYYGHPDVPNTNEQLQDMDGDGVMDVVVFEEQIGAGLTKLDVHIAYGRSDGLYVTLPAITKYGDIYTDDYGYETPEWYLSPNNGLPILKIPEFRELPWGCRVTTYTEYQWVGGKERSTFHDAGFPETPECAIARAQSADHQEAIRYLNFAYNSGTLSPENQVFVLYQLALRHTLEGESWAAKNYLDALKDLEDQKIPIAVNLTEQIQPLLEETEISPYKLCLSAEAIAQDIPNEYWNALQGVLAYPYEGLTEGYPTPLCNIGTIQQELDSIKFDPNVSPEVPLKERGIPVKLVAPVTFPDSTKMWLVVIEEREPSIISLGFGNAHTRVLGFTQKQGWQELAQFFSSFDTVQLNLDDVTGDGVLDIAFAYPDQNSSQCQEDETSYNISVLTAVSENWIVFYGENDFCQPEIEPFNLLALLEDKNADGIVDWGVTLLEEKDYDVALVAEIEPEQTWFYWDDLAPLIHKSRVIYDLTDTILTSPTPSLLRPDLEFYRARWSTGDDPASEQIYAHLTYLLALTYELEGNEPQAVELFYDLWANHPDTLWAYLAAARLELK
ncbi:MAG: hypothetical protein HUU38_13530 [Anaerolineales bacterium]|nr:hypothetical protein [Anaerolineales bacterium]